MGRLRTRRRVEDAVHREQLQPGAHEFHKSFPGFRNRQTDNGARRVVRVEHEQGPLHRARDVLDVHVIVQHGLWFLQHKY